MIKPYKKTVMACFIGAISQAIVVNFAPLLFVTFQNIFGIPLEEITVLISLNFITQFSTDLVASKYAKRIGYRKCLIAAHSMAGGGLIMMAFLPQIINPFAALIMATIIYAVGGGLLEVLTSPLLEACPTKNKSAIMSLMHSFYSWGVVGVVIVSTVFFELFGIHNWAVMACIWAMVPLGNIILLSTAPMYEISDSGEDKPNYKQLFSQKVFWLIIIIMLCSGAAELAVSQWASTFVEQGFHLSKSTGDLIGVGGFAAFMGLSRVIYSKCANRISPMRAIALSTCLCIVSYLMIGLSNSGVIGLMGCVICGFSVGILWPGTLSMASEKVVSGGTTMFALCALGGDIGCTSGPALAGFMTGVLGGDLRLGILCSIIFPILLIVALGLLKEDKKFKGR